MMAVGSFLGLVSFFVTARWLGAMEAMGDCFLGCLDTAPPQ